MKKVVSDFIKSFGLETGYSGSARVMYIQKGERSQEALRTVRDIWPNLAFYVRITEDIPEEAKEKTEDNKYLPALTMEELKKLPAPTITTDTIFNDASSKDAALKLRSDLDEYLLNNPIDKSQKGFYVPIAEKFGCSSDYVRKRYNSLKERNLI
jgi:hypothetical protein